MGEAIVWWITLQVLGLIALPLAGVVLRALPDRGYSASKVLGLLLTGWLGYILSMLGLPFERWLLFLCALAVAGLSAWLLLRNGRSLLNDLRSHYSSRPALTYIISAEALFAVLYVIWAVVRAYNPNIVDQEKFMDFGFLNSILKSGPFPPHDMWLAGHSINYYYFGYVLIAALTSLSGVATQVAFNLANVTLFALTALGSFGVVYNLVQGSLLREFGRARPHREKRARQDGRRARQAESAPPPEQRAPVPQKQARPGASTGSIPARKSRTAGGAQVQVSTRAAAPLGRVTTGQPEVAADTGDDGREPRAHDQLPPPQRPRPTAAYLPAQEERERPHVPWFLSPYIYAVLAALMVVAMGNLTTMFATKDRAAGADMQGNGFRFCFACNQGNSYDWFAPSRIIQDYQTVNGQKSKVGFETINEFPAFSFLLADMHPHVLALPLVLLALALGQAFARRRVLRFRNLMDGLPPGLHAWLTLVVAGITIGSLYTANTWDYPTYLLVVLACLLVPYLAAQRRSDNPRGWNWPLPWLTQAVLLVVLSLVVYLPFHLTFKSLVTGGEGTAGTALNIPLLGKLLLVNAADKTILGFLVIFGIFLVSLLVWLGYELVASVRKTIVRAGEEERTSYAPFIWAGVIVVILALAIVLRFPLLGLLLPMAAVALYAAWQEPGKAERNVALIMVAIAALIGLGIEVVFLRDNFQMRMNTLFKFYFQIWVLWALAAGYGLWRTLWAAYREVEAVRGRRGVAYDGPSGIGVVGKALSGVWAVAFLLLVISGLMYSLYGPMSRQGILNNGTLKGLDGAAWIRDSVPGDYDAINWLKANGTGSDAVLEAGSDEYQRPGRVSAYSGVATLVAWDNSHEALWRTNQPDLLAQIGERRRVVNAIYQGTDPDNGGQLSAQRMLDLLHNYKVTYVFSGATERGEGGWGPSNASQQMSAYAEGLFKQALPVAYQSGTTVVYAVKQGIEGTGVAPEQGQNPPPAGSTPAPAQSTPDPNVAPAGLFDLGPSGVNRGQFDLPRGIARDTEGNFYVTDTGNERIQKFDASGKWLAIFGSRGSGDGQFNSYDPTSKGTGPGGIAVDKAGNVYVADTWNHRIQKFDKDGKIVAKWGSFVNISDAAGASDPDANSKFWGPRGVAIGPNGNVYVTDTGNKRVLIFDPNGKFVSKIDSGMSPDKKGPDYPFNQQGELNEPVGVAVDSGGNVYVADSLNKRIQKFDPSGKFAAAWNIPGNAWDPGPYLEPFLAVDGSGNVYASGPTSRTIYEFSPSGQLLGQKQGADGKTLKLPTGVWADADGTTYAVDTNGNGAMKLGKIP